MRVGIACPYSFDVPGGVQFHVRDLAEHLIRSGHEVSVIAPADEDTEVPPYLVSSGKAVPVPYNGSVARLTFGPVTSARVTRWLEQGDFDVVHLHEPITPSVSIMALWAVTEQPIVATFHTSTVRSRAMHTFNPVLRTSIEKIRARIAVSEAARRTVRTHLGGDAFIIPNGVDTRRFAAAAADPRWVGTPDAPTLAFLGRIDEPRKGLAVLLEALPRILAARPGTRVIVAGPGDVEAVREVLDPTVAAAVEFLGAVSEHDKAAMLSSVDAYVAPHLGGESFGIVLVEAMAAGAPVVASDLEAFLAVLGPDRAGEVFACGDSAGLAERVIAVLGDARRRAELAARGHEQATRFDWDIVGEQVVAVYETVLDAAGSHPMPPNNRATRWSRIRDASLHPVRTVGWAR